MNKILKKTTVLIAEDDRFNRLLIISMLAKNKQIKVLEAKNGEEALKILSTHPVDMLLLDIYMPKMNGLETLKKIRNMGIVANIPIMVISSDETEMKKSLEFGANAFIAKPFKLKELEGQIYTLLGLA
jgi:CheY-like chemotaxis protein